MIIKFNCLIEELDIVIGYRVYSTKAFFPKTEKTLKQGVESMMRHYVPEVQAIESEDDKSAKDQGYTPWAV